LEEALIQNPQMIWPLWPGSAVLVSILLVVPGRVWPILIPAAFATFAVYDLGVGVPLRSIAWFVPANTVQVLTSALCLRYFFDGVPRLNSLKALAKYSIFAVIVAPFGAAFLSASGIGAGNYWDGWRICFLSEALAFATLTPAILSWIGEGPAWVREPRARHLEAAALIVGLVLLSYFTFNTSEGAYSPAFLYSLVPFLLWAALRFGWIGISTSVILVCIFTIRGAVHNLGPFSEQHALKDMLSLQLFLTFAAMPFMALAALAEDRKVAFKELALSSERVRESEERLRLATQTGKMYAYEWDVANDVIMRSEESVNVLGFSDEWKPITRRQLSARVHPDDRVLFNSSVDQVTRENPTSQISYRMLRPDGSVVWLEKRSRAFFDEQGKLQRMIGMVADITERKRTEEALLELNRALEAQTGLLQSREELLKIFVKSVPAGVAMLDRDMRYLQVSDRWCADYSVDSSQVLGRSHYELFPDMPQRWKEMHCRGLNGETLREDEDRWDREDGTRWIRWEIRPWRTPSGIVGGILIFAEDITHRKQIEEALSGMSRQLIEAQEEERARIGRELHDDINQRLAMLAIELDQLQDNPSQFRGRVQELRKQTIEISNDVQALSHELHSSKLEYLGALGAMRSWCKEFGERQGIQIDFKSTEVHTSVAPEIGLCLFRVLQEALHNAAKHSGVKRIEVRLREDSEIHLLVSDLGRGFDSETAMRRGLGPRACRSEFGC
jgi:PAS domain S-box-containing protein